MSLAYVCGRKNILAHRTSLSLKINCLVLMLKLLTLYNTQSWMKRKQLKHSTTNNIIIPDGKIGYTTHIFFLHFSLGLCFGNSIMLN